MLRSYRLRTIGIVGFLLAALAVAACGSDDSGNGGGGASLPQGSEPVDLDPADFTTKIDNPYWPMEPGSK